MRAPRALRGEAKLRAALAAFSPRAAGLVALDAGAAAGVPDAVGVVTLDLSYLAIAAAVPQLGSAAPPRESKLPASR